MHVNVRPDHSGSTGIRAVQASAELPSLDPQGTQSAATYLVQHGDSLSVIAERHGTTWQELARINGIANANLIRPGLLLHLPSGTPGSYTVQAGDTVGNIAARHGASVAALTRINGLANADLIFPGQVLLVPRRAPFTPAEAAAPAAPETEPGPQGTHRLGSLSERYESGGRGPGTVSTGRNDPGGVSYGAYQLSSNAGTLQSFMRNEGGRWTSEFGGARPGSEQFSRIWRAIAARDEAVFGDAQHLFIQRTHYQPAVATVQDRTGLDLDARHNAVRDAVWSVAVQHGGAATILSRAIEAAGRTHSPHDANFDGTLIKAIYAERSRYVLDVARNGERLSAGERQQLRDIVATRYPAELRDALAMLEQGQRSRATARDQPLDGRMQARQHGVQVKNGAAIGQLDAAMGPVISAVADAARQLGLPTPVITSGNDSRHRSGSLHYSNQALDFRGNNITDAQGRLLAAEVQRRLGFDYDVIFEIFPNNPANDHLHVEFDPR